MQPNAHAASDVGQRRERNEDCYLLDDGLQLYIVCDGMGGHASGDVASSRAVEFIAEFLRGRAGEIRAADDPSSAALCLAEQAVQEACGRLYALAASRTDYAGMGTTVTLLMVADDRAVMAHVGDSRLYLCRDGRPHLLSSDHTVANELFSDAAESNGALHERLGNILTRTVGCQQSVLVDTLRFDLLPGDVCLLCSDGLTRYLDPDELAEQLLAADPAAAPSRMIATANARGGCDNITAVVVRMNGQTASGAVNAEELNLRLDALRAVPSLSELPLGALLRILEIADVESHAAGEQVVVEGEPCAGARVVLEGQLSLSRGGQHVRDVRGIEAFGELCLVRPRMAYATLRCDDVSRTLSVGRREFLKMTQRLPSLGRKLLGRLLAEFDDDHPGGEQDGAPRGPL